LKLLTFEIRTHVGRHQRLGALTSDGRVLDVNFAVALRHGQRMADVLCPAAMLSFLESGDRALDAARETLASVFEGRGPNDETLFYSLDEIALRAPIPNPPALRDFYAFEAHVKRGFEKRGEAMPAEWYELPVYYKSGTRDIIGHNQPARWPKFTQKFDYELELAAVIGKRGTNLKAADARHYIAGYTVMNDLSARDIQRREMKVRLGPAKGKDWSTALGPWLVTADEIPDPYSLEMTAQINGEEWSRGNSRDLHWTFEQMLEFLTDDDTVVPGDVIGSGTVGTGCGLELDRWVQPGDRMDLTIERIGTLSNTVIRQPSL
jgi:2-keto-4-pentenoate hydratase/2-oxohepta-3-ene-1,7-dioic acid hydratase in catechol pathway